MITNYLPILNDSTRQSFFEYIKRINIPHIDYFAIGVQNTATKKSISLMSLPEWQQIFVANQYADYDPIRRVTLHTKKKFNPI